MQIVKLIHEIHRNKSLCSQIGCTLLLCLQPFITIKLKNFIFFCFPAAAIVRIITALTYIHKAAAHSDRQPVILNFLIRFFGALRLSLVII